MDPRTELVLYCVDRWIHADRVIRPALRRGMIVLSDRYYDSTMAYQGAGRKLPASFVRRWVLGVGDLPKPDLTVLLDCTVETGFRRLRHRGRAPDRMEREAHSFHRRVRAAYLRRAKKEPGRIRVIDSSRPRTNVLRDVKAAVEFILDPVAAHRVSGQVPITIPIAVPMPGPHRSSHRPRMGTGAKRSGAGR